jgi:hypothetical protein
MDVNAKSMSLLLIKQVLPRFRNPTTPFATAFSVPWLYRPSLFRMLFAFLYKESVVDVEVVE